MLGKKSLAAAVIAAFIAVAPATAYAAEPTPAPTYAPGQQSAPSLTATASSACVDGRPMLTVRVDLVDPDGDVATTAVSMTMNGSGNAYDFGTLGDVDENGQFTTTVAWPGSSDGGWPGYELVDGVWVNTGGNLAWTRGDVSLLVEVNPETTTPVAYPAEDPACTPGAPGTPGTTGNPSTTGTSSSPLAVTGSDFDATPLLFGAGGLIVIGGLALLVVRRRTARRS